MSKLAASSMTGFVHALMHGLVSVLSITTMNANQRILRQNAVACCQKAVTCVCLQASATAGNIAYCMIDDLGALMKVGCLKRQRQAETFADC